MSDERRYGRRAFLGIVGAGLGALILAEPLQRVVGSLDPVERAFTRGRWRIYNVASPMPVFEPERWRLRIDGLVARPVELRYEELRRLATAKHVADFHCVTGWSVRDVRWRGALVSDLLALAGPSERAGAAVFHSMEPPYFDSLTLEQTALPGVMLALDLDDEPLTRPHGAPARLVVPQMYGYKGVKWVERIELVEKPVAGFWEQRGWDWDAWVGGSNGRV